jgi:hypothetical protein
MITRALFTEAIIVLQRYTFEDLMSSRDMMKEQRKELEIEQKKYRMELENVYANVQTANKRYENQIGDINGLEIPKLQKRLIEQQKSSIYTQSKKLTIGRITECNQRIDMLRKSINENKLRQTRSAKILMSVIREIDKIDSELRGLDVCENVYKFIKGNKINLETLSQDQLDSVYGKFVRQAVE